MCKRGLILKSGIEQNEDVLIGNYILKENKDLDTGVDFLQFQWNKCYLFCFHFCEMTRVTAGNKPPVVSIKHLRPTSNGVCEVFFPVKRCSWK